MGYIMIHPLSQRVLSEPPLASGQRYIRLRNSDAASFRFVSPVCSLVRTSMAKMEGDPL